MEGGRSPQPRCRCRLARAVQATEAARAALHYGFEVMKRIHIISQIDPDNVRSIAVVERLGETRKADRDRGLSPAHVRHIALSSVQVRAGKTVLEVAGNGGQGATASLAFLASTAM